MPVPGPLRIPDEQVDSRCKVSQLRSLAERTRLINLEAGGPEGESQVTFVKEADVIFRDNARGIDKCPLVGLLLPVRWC